MPSKRRIHLGIDYGTCASKIVFRDYGAPGGELAVVVMRSGSFRIPSRICVTASELIFGDQSKSPSECDIYESLKMRTAQELTGKNYYSGPANDLPSGFDASDLAALTVWFLISEGTRAIESYLGGLGGVSIGMTMGVPMAFFNHPELRACFLAIARRGWLMYREEGLINSSLSIDKARRSLMRHLSTTLSAIPDYEIRDWVRSEAEAAMWWPYQSPATSPGPYAKLDIGAGTTHASLFRIYGDAKSAKTGLAFFGAVSLPFGMDAVDRAIAENIGFIGDWLSLRGSENSVLQTNAKARGSLTSVADDIYEPYRKSWIETYRKINENVAELHAWRDHKLFVIGGGSLISNLVERVRVHPGRHEPVDMAALDYPQRFVRADSANISKDELPFVTVAYGLSNIGLAIPEVLTPNEIPPVPNPIKTRERLDRDDIYAK